MSEQQHDGPGPELVRELSEEDLTPVVCVMVRIRPAYARPSLDSKYIDVPYVLTAPWVEGSNASPVVVYDTVERLVWALRAVMGNDNPTQEFQIADARAVETTAAALRDLLDPSGARVILTIGGMTVYGRRLLVSAGQVVHESGAPLTLILNAKGDA